jgi:aconitase A
LIQANEGADKDVASAMVSSKEIFEFLESAAKKYGIAFWGPGSGAHNLCCLASVTIYTK